MPPATLAASFWPIADANESKTSVGVLRETLYVRSFAPWQWFGGPDPLPGPIVNGVPIFCIVDCFNGNDRTFTTSTAPSVTSKITGIGALLTTLCAAYLGIVALGSAHLLEQYHDRNIRLMVFLTVLCPVLAGICDVALVIDAMKWKHSSSRQT